MKRLSVLLIAAFLSANQAEASKLTRRCVLGLGILAAGGVFAAVIVDTVQGSRHIQSLKPAQTSLDPISGDFLPVLPTQFTVDKIGSEFLFTDKNTPYAKARLVGGVLKRQAFEFRAGDGTYIGTAIFAGVFRTRLVVVDSAGRTLAEIEEKWNGPFGRTGFSVDNEIKVTPTGWYDYTMADDTGGHIATIDDSGPDRLTSYGYTITANRPTSPELPSGRDAIAVGGADPRIVFAISAYLTKKRNDERSQD